MAWSKNDYPESMKNLPSKTKDKAIEIANALLEEGYPEGRTIPISISQAEKWSKKDDFQDTCHIEYGSNQWNLKKEGNKQASFSFNTKDEAVKKGKELVKKSNASIIVHRLDHSIQQSIDD
ncbi:DUF2188 domain-containing protein [Metabacillus herbersteinensis]|uniref:DUF2188 domain-containing protein n=1 Tax=Metabacillus herbersteinensis TaxID=283816 RepID=A0ABV6GMF6_9BACI